MLRLWREVVEEGAAAEVQATLRPEAPEATSSEAPNEVPPSSVPQWSAFGLFLELIRAEATAEDGAPGDDEEGDGEEGGPGLDDKMAAMSVLPREAGGQARAVHNAPSLGQARQAMREAGQVVAALGDSSHVAAAPEKPWLKKKRKQAAGADAGWRWRDDVASYYNILGGLEKLMRERPSTGFFGNGDVIAGMHSLSASHPEVAANAQPRRNQRSASLEPMPRRAASSPPFSRHIPALVAPVAA